MAKTLNVNVHEAKTHLSRLIERVSRGEEVVICKAGQPVARLIPILPKPSRRTPGTWKDVVVVRDDFDAPLPREVEDSFSSKDDRRDARDP